MKLLYLYKARVVGRTGAYYKYYAVSQDTVLEEALAIANQNELDMERDDFYIDAIEYIDFVLVQKTDERGFSPMSS